MQSKLIPNLVGLAATLPLAIFLAAVSPAGLALADSPMPTASPMPTDSVAATPASGGSSTGLYSGTPDNNPGLYGNPTDQSTGLYGSSSDSSQSLYSGTPDNNPGLYGGSSSQDQGLGGPSSTDSTAPATDGTGSAPLPDTGPANLIGSAVGVSTIAFASFLYIRSRRLTKPLRKDGQIVL